MAWCFDLLQGANGWDLNLDPSTHSFRRVYDADWVTQKVRARIQWIYGEWFLQPMDGVPYFEKLLGIPNPDVPSFKAALVSQIAKTTGVKALTALTITKSTDKKTWIISFTGTIDDGSTFTGSTST